MPRFLLAWNKDGEDLGPEPDGDGPIQMIKPQFDPTETNMSKWLKWTRVVQVLPLGDDPGLDPTLIPNDRIILCGAIDADNVPSEWFFAEGCTGFGFEEDITILNPNPWETKIIVDYFIEGEDPQQQELYVKARTRTTINVAGVVGEGKNVSVRVEGCHGDSIVAERAMYWNGRKGNHCEVGVNAPDDTWYFAKGCTAGDFETWVLLQNPGEEDVTAYVTYQTAEGAVEREPLLLEAGSRFSINVGLDVGETWEVSTLVRSTAAIVVEHAVYWNGKTEGTCLMGFSKM